MTDQIPVRMGCNTSGVLGWPYLETFKQKVEKWDQ